ncbi:hypothetical protein [Paraoerskovia marina]|uniref:hypothetical protein n=1 Tax=Paraoerskovia marina TaxID=545619 RepID=UPI0004926647|nr:hypothetical protein [Paraoerskovia marina]
MAHGRSLGTCGALLAALVLAGCGSTPAVSLQSEFLDAVDAAGEGSGTLDLVPVLHDDWQRVVVACPGTDEEAIAAALEVESVDGDLPDLGDEDTGWLLLVNGSTVTDVVDVPRDEADLCAGDGGPDVLTPGSPTMTVAPGETDGAWVVSAD